MIRSVTRAKLTQGLHAIPPAMESWCQLGLGCFPWFSSHRRCLCLWVEPWVWRFQRDGIILDRLPVPIELDVALPGRHILVPTVQMQAQVIPIHRHRTEGIVPEVERKARAEMKHAVGTHEEVEFVQLQVDALPLGPKA